MIKVGDVLVSDEIRDMEFVCHLEKCKGACCVEGDYGAPLEVEELPVLKKIYPRIKSYLTAKGIETIESEGTHVVDPEGDYSTPVIKGRECVYSHYDKNGILKCGIEEAHRDGKIAFRKPISCHLYPIRITKKDNFEAVNYHKWSICSAACTLGKRLKVPLYKFLKDPLIRKYGRKWYLELVARIEYQAGEGAMRK
ncbi:MAG TPA: DUF3109 family protein [Cyclobacteriaceae bacterium]